MKTNSNMSIQLIKDKFHNFLIEKGYPEETIVYSWGKQGLFADLAIIPRGSEIPVAVFEIKLDTSSASIGRGVSMLRSLTEDVCFPMLCIIISYINSNDSFKYLDVTDYVYKKVMLNPEFQFNYNLVKDHFPDYRGLVNRAVSISRHYKKKQESKRHFALKIICWIVVPFLAIALLLLEVFLHYELSTNRIIIIGFVIGVAFIPFSSKISIKDFEFKIDDSKK